MAPASKAARWAGGTSGRAVSAASSTAADASPSFEISAGFCAATYDSLASKLQAAARADWKETLNPSVIHVHSDQAPDTHSHSFRSHHTITCCDLSIETPP